MTAIIVSILAALGIGGGVMLASGGSGGSSGGAAVVAPVNPGTGGGGGSNTGGSIQSGKLLKTLSSNNIQTITQPRATIARGCRFLYRRRVCSTTRAAADMCNIAK